jgi:hypothetical protein
MGIMEGGDPFRCCKQSHELDVERSALFQTRHCRDGGVSRSQHRVANESI